MRSIPVIAADPGILAEVGEAARDPRHRFLLEPITDVGEAFEQLSCELPEAFVVDLSDDGFDARSLLRQVQDDWLLGGAIVAVCDEGEAADLLEKPPAANIAAVIPKGRVAEVLPRVLRILDENQHLLSRRDLGHEIAGDIEGTFIVRNDPIDAYCYESLLCNFLYTSNRIAEDAREALGLSIHEMLMNAIEHGNCGITFDEKTRWLEGGGRPQDLIAKYVRDPDIAKKHVKLEYRISPERSRFVITDEGEGFDWRNARQTPKERTSSVHTAAAS